MKASALLIAALCLAYSAAPRRAVAGPDQKAIQRAMEHQRKLMEQEARRQQEYEKKLMEQQRKAIQQEIHRQQDYQKAMMEQQKRAIQAEHKLMEQQQKAMRHQQDPRQPSIAAHAPTYHQSHPYYGHHSYGHPHHRNTYNHHRQWPTQQDPETIALEKLKQSLDAVRMNGAVTPAERTAIKNALMRVVEVPKVPTIAAIQALSGHLADALANRGAARAETAEMALTLRGVMNSTDLATFDLTAVMNEHRAALRVSKVRPAEVTAVMDSLKTISNQERAHR